MNTPETLLDSLVHNLSDSLQLYGIKLDADLMCDLNDHLSDFLTDKCEIDLASSMKLPREYRVRWEIDIDANDPADAARRSREIQLDHGSDAVVFEVLDGSGNATFIDLNECGDS